MEEEEDIPESGAELLDGRDLPNGWRVVERIQRSPKATGGCFSIGYKVENADGRKGFLKALDYSAALRAPDTPSVLKSMIDAFVFERDLLNDCVMWKIRRVVRAIDSGQIVVPRARIREVNYLIFELADGDVREHLDFANQLDAAFSLRTVHNVAAALEQLHYRGVAHQDLKPSNVLVFSDVTKIADFGCASRRGAVSPRDGVGCAGAVSYAPPELRYGDVDTDWVRRRLACDVYLLGSLVMYLFTGVSTSSALYRCLDQRFQPGYWQGRYVDLLSVLYESFGQVLEWFEQSVPDARLARELRAVVHQLCDPDPKLRGDPVERGRPNQYGLRRYVSKFDCLARRAELGISR
jgi:eukaryotic-like serine/threonine-protein kinase